MNYNETACTFSLKTWSEPVAEVWEFKYAPWADTSVGVSRKQKWLRLPAPSPYFRVGQAPTMAPALAASQGLWLSLAVGDQGLFEQRFCRWLVVRTSALLLRRKSWHWACSHDGVFESHTAPWGCGEGSAAPLLRCLPRLWGVTFSVSHTVSQFLLPLPR